MYLQELSLSESDRGKLPVKWGLWVPLPEEGEAALLIRTYRVTSTFTRKGRSAMLHHALLEGEVGAGEANGHEDRG